MALRRRGGQSTLDAWPGYVDALSTLLMVITFVLLVFVLAQAFLSVSLANKNTELETLDRQIAQLTDMLSLEKGRTAELTLAVAGLNKSVHDAEQGRASAQQGLTAAQTRLDHLEAANATLTDQNSNLLAQLSDAQTEAKSADTRIAALQQQVGDAAISADRTRNDAAQIALLNQQLIQLRLQLAAVSADLDLSQSSENAKSVQIGDLTARLNVALANKVEELQRYRSEFFGRLREVLKGRPGITVVGDRFVFQSEVLFPVGSADMSAGGKAQIEALATTLEQIARKIPATLPWMLRVDGHADRQPLAPGGRFSSNWELSAERSINVVRFLIARGVPAQHLAATAFADTQPLAPGDSAAEYAKNRRIELRLTDR